MKKKGDYKNAYHYRIKYEETVDSLFSTEKIKASKKLEKQFDSEKRELEIDNLKKEKLINEKELEISSNQKQKQLFIILGVSLVLVLVFIFAIIIMNRLKLTNKQKQIIEDQKQIVEEKQKEIIDSIHYAKRIQQALLPKSKYIEKVLERLKKN